jgi:hypothetical protein
MNYIYILFTETELISDVQSASRHKYPPLIHSAYSKRSLHIRNIYTLQSMFPLLVLHLC